MGLERAVLEQQCLLKLDKTQSWRETDKKSKNVGFK